ncbi:glycosyltransferase [Formicincola oecophyllae]|nr:glycosyltransferase [Formicincola oecophyllae]
MPQAAPSFGAAPLILDISRLLNRAGASVPTGIDRVELAYARLCLTRPDSVFVAMHPMGTVNVLQRPAVAALVGALCDTWLQGRAHTRKARHLASSMTLGLLKPNLAWWRLGTRMRHQAQQTGQRPLYLLLSHHHLHRPRAIRRIMNHFQARFVPMVHDLIPLDYPEYARPVQEKRHRQRLNTVQALSHAILTPAQHVADRLKIHYQRHPAHQATPPIIPVLHGVDIPTTLPQPSSTPPLSERAEFVVIGTIEPRKNHLLLLHFWRAMAQDCVTDPAARARLPILHVVGKRGWENENILDLLERCRDLQGLVVEHNNMVDEALLMLLSKARGLLFPSFDEGFGLPLVEALALKVPVICSDLPVFHEIAGALPDYVDSLDGMRWRMLVEDYCRCGPLWQAQRKRLSTTDWQPRSWRESIMEALSKLQAIQP